MTTTTAGSGQFDIGRVFSRTWGVIGANFVPFILLALLFDALPAVLLSFLRFNQATQLPTTFTGWGQNFGFGVIQLGLGYVLSAALVRGTIMDLDGRKASLGDCLVAGVKNAIPAFVIALITGVAVFFGLCLLIVPGVILALAWSVATPVLVVERKGIFGSLGRSAALTRGHRWAMLGLIVCFILLMIVISIPFGIAGAAVSFAASNALMPRLIANAIGSTIGAVFGAVMYTAAYAELRGAREGVGVTELASVFD